MKKTIALLLSRLLAASAVSCSQQSAENGPEQNAAPSAGEGSAAAPSTGTRTARWW